MTTSCEDPKSDLALICNASDQTLNDLSIPESEKLTYFLKEIYALDLSSGTKKFIHELSYRESISYQIFQDFAEQNDVFGWECNSLKEFLR